MMNKKIKKDMKNVLKYLWHDEECHYFESGRCKNHIFSVLKRLAKVIEYEP